MASPSPLPVTIVMYHYVRPLARSRYPGLKGRTVEAFEAQLDHLQRHYAIISAEQLVAAVHGDGLPPNAAVLTFDDGYLEHYSVVFPALKRRGLSGLFFPAAQAVLERRLLDVNRIHVALALHADHAAMAAALCRWVDARRDALGLDAAQAYWQRLAKPSRFDAAETMFVKRMLQRELPAVARGLAHAWLAAEYLDVSEAVLAEEFYVTADQLAVMAANGMYIGSHGYSHAWLDTLDADAQADEVDRSLEMLRAIDAPTDRWIMCYPQGAWNDGLLALLRDRNCAVGLTTRVAQADLARDPALLLPRLDTNDLPPG